MISDRHESIPTRESLLSRLKNWDDSGSWNDFFNTYWKLIYNAAIKMGLTESEAQDVVQETVISIAKNMPKFRYRKENGSFKGWLLTLTRWRIIDQLRKRDSAHVRFDENDPESGGMVDAFELEGIWNDEWNRNLVDAAINRVKGRIDPRHFQIFDAYVLQRWPIKKVSSALDVSVPRVYLIKHRVTRIIKREIEILEKGNSNS